MQISSHITLVVLGGVRILWHFEKKHPKESRSFPTSGGLHSIRIIVLKGSSLPFWHIS